MTRKILLGLFTILVIGLLAPAYAASPGSPLDQYNSGIPLEMITCDDGKILMQSPSGKPTCLTIDSGVKLSDRGYTHVAFMEGETAVEETMMADEIAVEETMMADEIAVEENISTSTDKTINEISQELQITTLQVASPVEFVDDGREYNVVSQKRPSPEPIYDKIMSSDLVIGNNDISGTASISSPPHEKYSKNQGVGLYIEDWMPTYIPDGYKLLYADSNYRDYSQNHNPHSTNNVHWVKYYFVPSDFVLYPNATDHSLFRQSDGFSVATKISSEPFDELEDIAERLRESRASQSGDYSEFRDMTRDGKYVSAYQGGNDLNFYTAHVAFAPNEYTIMRVNSNYLTLDELIPVFESIMK